MFEGRKQRDALACSRQSQEFAMIAKISLGLRKFRNPSDIGNFRYIAKFR